MSGTTEEASQQKRRYFVVSPPYDEDDTSREYHAFRGKMTARQRFVLCVPTLRENGEPYTHDRCLPLSDIRLFDPGKDGREIIIECSAFTVKIVGKNLRKGALAIANDLCGSIEAFDPDRHDKPADPKAPFIESIRFYAPARPEDKDANDKLKSGGGNRQPAQAPSIPQH